MLKHSQPGSNGCNAPSLSAFPALGTCEKPAEPLPMRNISGDDFFVRGDDQQQSGMFNHVSPEEQVPQDHPLHRIREMVDGILRAMNKDFEGLYAKDGRPSIPPERLLRAVLLQIFQSVGW